MKELRDLLDEISRISVAELVPLLSEGVVLVRDEYQGAGAGETRQKVEGQRTVIHGGGMHNHDRSLECA